MLPAENRLALLAPMLRRHGVERWHNAPEAQADWSLLGLAGRLVELDGEETGVALTAAFGLVLDAQNRGEPVAWITGQAGGFFPPDVAESGVDLAALVVVRTPEVVARGRAADQLARSGGFGLLVVDLTPGAGLDKAANFQSTSMNKGANFQSASVNKERAGERVPAGLLSRLLGLAQKHEIAIVFLTDPSIEAATSLGSLISLRAEARRSRCDDGGFVCELSITKDKRRAPGWTFKEKLRGPTGLR